MNARDATDGSAMEYSATQEVLEPTGHVRVVPTIDGSAIPHGRAVELVRDDAGFRAFFSGLIARASFDALRWETPAFSRATSEQPFEFVLVDAQGFASRSTDPQPFAEHFTSDSVDEGVITFQNLRGDAALVVPSPRTEPCHYGHLAAFLRGAPPEQVDALWHVVGRELTSRLGEKPLWLSTAGGGVAWLHVRIDSRPKYYAHRPYADPAVE